MDIDYLSLCVFSIALDPALAGASETQGREQLQQRLCKNLNARPGLWDLVMHHANMSFELSRRRGFFSPTKNTAKCTMLVTPVAGFS